MTVLLGFIGGKMIVELMLHVPDVASLSVIAGIIAGVVAASLRHSWRQTRRAALHARPDVPGAPPARARVRRSTA